MINFSNPGKFASLGHWRDWFRLRSWRRLSAGGQKLALVQKHATFLVSTDDSIIGRSVYETGNHDYFKLTRALRFLQKTSVKCLLDVGANIGTICIPAVVDGLTERAIAVEPDPLNFNLLRVNSVLNNVDDLITCVRAAAGHTSEPLLLNKSSINHGDHRTVRGNVSASEGGENLIKVDAFSLDELYPERSGQDLLWIDVQGFEVDVLRGAAGLLETGMPIVLEFCPSDLFRYADLNELLEALSDYTHFADLGREEVHWRPLSELELLVRELGINDGGTDIVVCRA